MTSGNIPLGPGPDRILEALTRAVREDPVLVAEGLEAEEESLRPDELSEEGNPI